MIGKKKETFGDLVDIIAICMVIVAIATAFAIITKGFWWGIIFGLFLSAIVGAFCWYFDRRKGNAVGIGGLAGIAICIFIHFLPDF